MEIWKNIKNYEGIYQVSNLGRIKSLKRKSNNKDGEITLKEKILKGSINNNGYNTIYLYKIKQRKSFRVHRIVAEHFIENPLDKKEVNHKDGNKLNNCARNLEWATPKENTNHAHNNNLVRKKFGKNHHRSKEVMMYDLKGNLLKIYESTREAIKDGYSSASISRACNNIFDNGNRYKNHIWRFV